MEWKCCKEAGKLPASLLMGAVALMLGGCGVQVSSSSNLNGTTLDCTDFVNSVFTNVLIVPINGKSCKDCHYVGSTTGGGFKFFPVASSVNNLPNYYAALGFTDLNNPANSRLLLKPLGDPSVGGHSGGAIFTGTSDPYYRIVLTWMNNRIQGPSQCP